MVLTPADTRALFEQECAFPTSRDAVVDALGDVRIRSPNGDPATVESVLARSDQTTFDSVTELHTTLMTYLDDDHIGRKYYDDRGGQSAGESVRAEPDVSA